jgi:RNA polymerase sigma factor (sigma-70 family)
VQEKITSSIEADVDRLIRRIETALTILPSTGTPPIAAGPTAWWRPAPIGAGPRAGWRPNKQKRRDAKKAVGRGNALPGPLPPLTEPRIFEPLPRKWTQNGIVAVRGSAVELLAKLILQHSPLAARGAPLAPAAAPEPTEEPAETVFAAVERELIARAVTPYFTPEMHEAIERVHRAVMRHNISASSSAYWEAFNQLGKHHHHWQNAKDLSQRTKLRILERFDTLIPWRVPNALLSKTCRRLFYNDCEKRAREAEDSTGYLSNAKLATPPTQEFYEESVEHYLTLTDLPPEQQELLIRRFTFGFSYAELAAHYSVSAGTIASRLHRASEKLRKGKRPVFDTAPSLPMGLTAEQWVDPAAAGSGCSRGFNPAGFEGPRTEQLKSGERQGGFEQAVFKDGRRVLPDLSLPDEDAKQAVVLDDADADPEMGEPADPADCIPVTPELNDFYLAMLQHAHRRALARGLKSYCYPGCSCIGTRYEAILPGPRVAGVMDAIEKSWELPEELQKWRRTMREAEPHHTS